MPYLCWAGRIDASGDNRKSTRSLFAQYVLQRIKIKDLDDRRGIRDEPISFELLELPMKRGPGNIHDHRPIGDRTGYPDHVFAGLSCLDEKMVASSVMKFFMIRKSFCKRRRISSL